MLVLTLKGHDDYAVIECPSGEQIKVYIVEVVNAKKRKVRVGFEGPREVPVHRRSVAERIQEGKGEV